MAHQESFIKLKGRIGDLTFYKTSRGYQTRQKSGVSGDRIMNDPKFQRTRENAAEFARACKASKLLRSAFKQVIVKGADGSLSNRLTRLFSRIVKADATNARGERMVLDAEVEMLAGFEFNMRGIVSATVHVPFSPELDRASGELKVSFPAFKPAEMISAPQGATHFRFKAAASSINFELEEFKTEVQIGQTLSMDAANVPAFQLSKQMSPNVEGPILMVLGIEFFQMVNGEEYLLSNGAFNGLSIIKVDGGV